jgi:hypothetical protein
MSDVTPTPPVDPAPEPAPVEPAPELPVATDWDTVEHSPNPYASPYFGGVQDHAYDLGAEAQDV